LPEYSLGRAQLIEQKAAAARAEREAALEKERKAVVERMRMRKALEESQAELGANPVDYAFTDIAPAEDDKGRLESFEETRARMNVWINKNKIKVLSVETVVVPHQLVETGAYASGARKRRVKKGAVEEMAVSFHRWDHVLRVWYDANDADNKATGHAGAEPMRLVRSDVLTSLDQSLCCTIS
jgi:hypothetical protein